MLKFLICFLLFFAAVQSFDYVQFKRKYCFDDKDIRSTSYYFPYDTGYTKVLPSAHVCEDFVLTKEDLDYMANNSFSISTQERVVFKNCEIEYFNEYLVSKFPNSLEIYFENCTLSLKNPEVIGNAIVPKSFWGLGFHKCNILENVNSSALQQFKLLRYILIQNSTFQFSNIDESFLPDQNNMFSIYIDNTNVETFHKGFLTNITHTLSRIFCTSCGLEEIDSLFYQMKQNVDQVLSFDNNSIKKFPMLLDIMPNFKQLQEMHLSGNDITETLLKRIYLKELRNLRILDLSRNSNINEISYLAFKDTSLENLNMSNVNLRTLNKLGNSSLITIDFSHNLISTIPQDVFEGLKNLKFLDLSYNKIKELQGAVFESLLNLESLYLNSNEIQEIPTIIFNALVNLKILDLSNNILERFDGLKTLPKLQELYLYNNNLKMIPSSLSLPNSLRVLDIFNNSLNFVGTNTFSNLNQLTSLDMSFTNHTYVNFANNSFEPLKSLQYLKLKGNGINSIEDVFLPPTLKELDLSFNKMPTITRKGLEGLINLEYLNLANNHIYFIEEGLMEELREIMFVDISGNDL